MSTSEETAREILETVPQLMRSIRSELRRNRAHGLSVPQFRIMVFLNGQPGASLSAVAEHIGLTLPSISSMVDCLVQRGLVARQTCPEDRRRVTLSLTPDGQAQLELSFSAAQNHLSKKLARLTPAQHAEVISALQILRSIFSPGD